MWPILGITVVPIIILGYFALKVVGLRLQVRYLSADNAEMSSQNELLQQEKISHIKKIEQLSSKIEYLEKLTVEADRLKKESLDSAKAALFNLGGELSKQLIEISKRENKEARELAEKNIGNIGTKFNSEFERLVNMIASINKEVEHSRDAVDLIKQSLLSPSGVGRLAEITLENILKASGLKAGLDFVIQHSINTEENSRLRPDAMIFLPNGNLMVIDAKASKFLLDDLEPGNLSKTMNIHLKSLTGKEYGENVITNFNKLRKDSSLNNVITLMFLPTEHAVEKIFDADNGFMNKVWAANIFPVGPAGLMNMLSFAKFQIAEQMRSENHKSIIEEVRKLIISISSISEHSQRLGTNIQAMVNNYDKFAASFNRNFLSRAKNIQKLGIDAGSKNITSTLERYHLISAKSELVDPEIIEEE